MVGAVNVTVTLPAMVVAAPIVGAAGTPIGVTLFEAADAAPVPNGLVAVTVQVTATLLGMPATTMGDAAPLFVCAPQIAV